VVAGSSENVQAYLSPLSTTISRSAMPCARAWAPGTRGRACLAVREVCQKIACRSPRTAVITNWLRASRPRSSTRSMAAPRRTQDLTGTRSTTSASAGHSSTRWQYTFAVRGQVSFTLSRTPCSPNGMRTM
jgi:hypothetical protein